MRRWAVALLALVVSAAAPAGHIAKPAYGPGIAFPFTAEDDSDGARYVWFMICHSGFRYDYIPASAFPNSKRFREVSEPRSGDVAWWPTHVSLYDADKKLYVTAVGFFQLSDLKSGFPPPKYYRLQLFGNEAFVDPPPNGDRTSDCIPKP